MTSNVGDLGISQSAQIAAQALNNAEVLTAQDVSESSFAKAAAEDFNPVAMGAKMDKVATLKPPINKRVQKAQETGGKTIEAVKSLEDALKEFQEKDSELNHNNRLMNLRGKIKPGMSKEEIMGVIDELFHDAFQGDEAFDFLLEVPPEGLDAKDVATIREAKAEYAAKNKRAIAAGRIINAQAQEAKNQGLGIEASDKTAESYRDVYLRITSEMPDPPTLFIQLSKKYKFEEIQKVLKLMYHSLGSDLKAGGAFIPRGQLNALMKTTRALQASFGVYRFFQSRIDLVKKMFAEQ